MENQSTARVVTLKNLWNILIHRLWIIVLVAIISVAGAIGVTTMTFVPEYASTATLYILRQNADSAVANTTSDFSLALTTLSDCTHMMKSHCVLDQVMEDLSLDLSYEELSQSISTANPDNTRILEVTVVAESPELAKQIVDSVCEIGAEQIAKAMGFQQVNLYEYGVLEEEPCNRTSMVTYILIGIIAAIITYSIFLLLYILDDRIRTDEDVERYFGLSILGSIPNASETKKGRYGYYSIYKTKSQTTSESASSGKWRLFKQGRLFKHGENQSETHGGK